MYRTGSAICSQTGGIKIHKQTHGLPVYKDTNSPSVYVCLSIRRCLCTAAGPFKLNNNELPTGATGNFTEYFFTIENRTPLSFRRI